MLRRFVFAVCVAVLLAGLGWQLVTGWAPDRATFPTQGVNVSARQGDIDWKTARSAGVDFAYLEASEGRDRRDDRFASNWAGSLDAGIKRGAYHVFDLCAPGREQATNFISLVPREAEALPPAVKLEFGKTCTAPPPRQNLLTEIAIFIRMVEAHSEKPVMLALSHEFENQYRISEAIDRPLWLRRAAIQPSYGNHPWVMWQANPNRHVDGVAGAVGWDVVRAQ